MIDMREDDDGVFRPHGPDEPLPYGLPEDPQEPYVSIVAPNIDKISGVTFNPRTFTGRRTLRSVIVLASFVVGSVAVIGVVVAVQWVMSLFGVV